MKKLLTAVVCAVLAVSSQAGEKEVQEKLVQSYPNMKAESIKYMPEVKLYEILMKDGKGQQVPLYTNENIDYIFLSTGELLDPKSKKNMTVERDLIRTKDVFNKLPFNEAFNVKYGKGTRKIAVFSDPDCPYCQEMEKNFAKNMKADVTVYYFMNPLVSLHPQAGIRAAQILCDKDPAKAWVRYTTNAPGLNKSLAASWQPDNFLPKNDGQCQRGKLVQKQYDLSSQFGFNSTPSIMLDNGYVVRDTLTPGQIEQLLAK